MKIPEAPSRLAASSADVKPEVSENYPLKAPNAQNSSNQRPLHSGSRDCNIPWLRPPAKAKSVAKVCWCTGFTSCHVETTAKEPSILATCCTTKYSWIWFRRDRRNFCCPKVPSRPMAGLGTENSSKTSKTFKFLNPQAEKLSSAPLLAISHQMT